jgi:hypothetical protein
VLSPEYWTQLLGVRRPGAAFGPAHALSRLMMIDCSLTTRRQPAADHSGARPPHSKEFIRFGTQDSRLETDYL